jgi:sucrose-6-phosphate hydrolase SacC (GH32 family)
MSLKQTPYVNIQTLRNGDEKRYWFKVPDGETLETTKDKAMEIIMADLEATGRNPKLYNMLVGRNEYGLTLRAVYDYEREKNGKLQPHEIEAYRNWKEVQKVINSVAR